ncbi:MAG TPA: TIGR01777 family oxidoreductase [Acidimicrobiales bacterium]|jgi:hypothetical protein|nr:TIGR01777 family oxidoreductase [Acidimicrobiales bacterium]
MDVVISGSSGFIGRALTESLRAAGHRPIRLVRHEPTGDSLSWDPSAGTIDRSGLEGVDAVVHLAGEGIASRRWTAAQKRRILESRTQGTSLLATTLAALQRPPRVLISASAIGVYGERGDEIVTESSPPGTGFLSEVVLAWEAATAPAVEVGIRVVHTRSGMVLDRRGGALRPMLWLFRPGLGGRLGRGHQYWSWIELDDEIGAISWLLDHDVTGPVNLTAPEPVTNAEFTRALGAALHRPARLPVPSFGPKLLLGAELANALLFTSARVVPQKLLDAGYSFRYPDIAGALRAAVQRR